MLNNIKAEKIANKARNSISNFCINDCKSYCCRKGYLILKKDEVPVVTQNKQEELTKKGLLKKIKDKFSLYLGNYSQPCPSLKEFKCSIYKNPKRPKVCHDFPIFLKEDKVYLSPRCLAVKQNLFYPFLKKLTLLGYKIEESDPFYDLELYNVEFKKN